MTCPHCGEITDQFTLQCTYCGKSLMKRPTEQDAERAKEIARGQGWLTPTGWIWEKPS